MTSRHPRFVRVYLAALAVSLLPVTACRPRSGDGDSSSSLRHDNPVTSTTATTISVSSLADNLRAYSDIIKAEAAYISAVGDYNLKNAQAQLQLAMAAGEWQKARMLSLEADRLELELRRLRRAEAEAMRTAERVEDKIRSLNQMIVGRVTPSAIQAMEYLQITAIPSEVTLAVMTTEVAPIGRGSFSGEDVPEDGFRGGNLGQYFQFLKETRTGVEPYSPAHLPILAGLQQFGEKAQERLALLETKIKELDTVPPRPTPTPG
jgi:hypothetical protein